MPHQANKKNMNKKKLSSSENCAFFFFFWINFEYMFVLIVLVHTIVIYCMNKTKSSKV